jgi:hypothetical protein
MDEREIVETDVDELWLREWAQSGLVAVESYLAKHAAFAEFLRRQAHLESDDDGSARSV